MRTRPQGMLNEPRKHGRQPRVRRPTGYVRVSVSIADHPDLTGMPSDAGRWAFIVVLTKARLQPELGVFRSEQHLRNLLGWRLARQVPYLFAAGLLEHSSDESRSGAVEVHNWSRWQSQVHGDSTHAERSRRYRERERAKSDASRDGGTGEVPGDARDGGPPLTGVYASHVTPHVDDAAVTVTREEALSARRSLAQAIRDATEPSLKRRYQEKFQCSRCRYSTINEDRSLRGWQQTDGPPRRYRCSDCAEVPS